MGFDIQRLAELLKLAEEYNLSQYGKGNPRDVEAKTLDQIFNERVSGQTDPFDPISKFLMDSPVSFCLDAISIMYVGQKFPQGSELLQDEATLEFTANKELFKDDPKEQIIHMMNKPALNDYLKRGYSLLGIDVPFSSKP